MESSGDFNSPPELDYEGWRDLLRSLCGRYNPEGINPKTFAGWVRPVNVCGFTALNIACNADGSSGRTGTFASMARIITLLSFSSLANQQ